MADREGEHHAHFVQLAARAGGLVLTLFAALIMAGCATASRPAPAQSRSAPQATRRGQTTAAATHTMISSPVTSTTSPPPMTAASGLTLDQLAGQRVIYSYAGLIPPPSLLAAIRGGEAGGVIFFTPNIASVPQIRAVIQTLQRARLSSPVHAPLLMMTDQEGGEVRRLPGPPALSEKQIGESPDSLALAHASGHAAGEELIAAGMNLNLAPVLDVYRSPGNFIDQYQRSYSNNPTVVAGLGAAFITAQQATGVAATAKHFPGLGAATRDQDTDLGPVVLDQSAAQLRAVDEAPYRAAIAAGVKAIMVSWARYPALDPARPAGLSSKIIDGELRDRLGFHGVTITDGIDAGAVLPYGDLSERGVLAAQAGADLILCAATTPAADTPAQGVIVVHGIAHAIADRQIPLAAARASVTRILALRDGFR
jgi:beta-N-acetylhexosaminidase